MKKFLWIFTLALAPAFACEMPSDFVDKALFEIREENELLPNAGLQLSAAIKTEISKMIDIRHCADSDIYLGTYLTKSGLLFHLAYTIEDNCDGGNSFGVVLDANLQQIASILDSGIDCPVKDF